jgi:hypothetical protein
VTFANASEPGKGAVVRVEWPRSRFVDPRG